MNFEYIDNLDNILNYLAEKVISKDITEDQAAEIYSEACNDATYISESTIDEDVKKDLLSVFEAEDTEDDTEQKESIKDKIKAKAASAKRIIKKAAPVAVAAGAIGTAAYLNSDRHKTNVAKRKLGYDTAKDRQEHYVDYRERKYQDKSEFSLLRLCTQQQFEKLFIPSSARKRGGTTREGRERSQARLFSPLS